MKLIVGLGNPGKKYEKTRHNVGFRIIDALEKEISDRNIILLKPQTFMNQSGKAVKKLIPISNLKSQNLIVIHDDIDLPLGTIRMSKNSSSGGHKGIQSIINELGTKNFTRIRVGIQPKLKIKSHAYRQAGQKLKVDTERFVLQQFTKAEEKIIEKVIEKVVEIIKESIKAGIKKTTITIS